MLGIATECRVTTLEDCPIGLFLSMDAELCLKTEYGLESYIVSSGERFWGGAKNGEELRNVRVVPFPVIN
jgi:hypothetical protein